MIEFLKGRLIEKTPSYIVVECNGVGYYVNISLHTYGQIGNEEAVQVLTHFQVKEDAQNLYGFKTKDERQVFRQLISVSGIGTATAQMMLSSLSPDEVRSAILSEDVATLKGVKGIGAKTAQRVIIDLRDKMGKEDIIPEISGGLHNTAKQEALSALIALGFDRAQANKVLDKLVQDAPDSGIEDLIKAALKKL
jgi:Holliday junction DNA helicase RuvA